MKKNTPEQLLEKLKDIRLSDHRRVSMRADLEKYADFHTVPEAPTIVAFPYIKNFLLSTYTHRSAFAILLFCSITGTSVYAAETSLPGNVLYPIKTHVTEPVQTALIPTTKGKASWHAVLAERRIEEVTLLAIENNLDTETQAALAGAFEEHVKRSLDEADTLARSGQKKDSLEVREDLEARLVAHTDILEAVYSRDDIPVESVQSKTIEVFIATVQERQEEVTETRMVAAEEISIQEIPYDGTPSILVIEEETGNKGNLIIDLRTEDAIDAKEELDRTINLEAKGTTVDPKDQYLQEREVLRTVQILNILREHEDILNSVDNNIGIIQGDPKKSTDNAEQSSTTQKTL